MLEDLCPVMLFSGKGGVGKTTLAAATAVRLAAAGSRVLIVSTDPAHSLSDVFDVPLAGHPTRVAQNLEAMEVDAKAMFIAAGPSETKDAESSTMARLVKMASETPGVDEFGAIEVLLGALEDDQHDVVILDTAPTGHTLRLLMLPELLDGWLGTLLQLRDQFSRAGRLLRKLLPRGGAQPSAEELETGLRGSRERIARLRRVLSDPNRAQIFLVTIPEAMSVLETVRTLQLLQSQRLAVGAIIVNQMQPQSAQCAHCRRRREIHDRELERLRDQAQDVPLRLVESVASEVRGRHALAEMAERLWGARTDLHV